MLKCFSRAGTDDRAASVIMRFAQDESQRRRHLCQPVQFSVLCEKRQRHTTILMHTLFSRRHRQGTLRADAIFQSQLEKRKHSKRLHVGILLSGPSMSDRLCNQQKIYNLRSVRNDCCFSLVQPRSWNTS